MKESDELKSSGAGGSGGYRGQVVYIYAFDIAYDMKRLSIPVLAGQKVEEYTIGPSKRSPKQAFFYRPQMIRMAAEEKQIGGKSVMVEQSVKIFNVGAISIQIRIPFEAVRFEDIVSYHEPIFDDGDVQSHANEMAERIRQELLPYCVKPIEQLGQAEAYTIFCLDELPASEKNGIKMEEWLMKNRRLTAGLLTEEAPESLSEQEVLESTEQYVSYYEKDLVVMDWDAALVVGQGESLDEVLHIMELANVQLVELAAYDRIMDGALEGAYRDLARRRVRRSGDVRQNLREMRVDLSRFNDELLNIRKFFGDWYLAKIYRSISERFHLADWQDIINEKIKTLGDLYQFLQQDWVNVMMVVMEAAIVFLFIVDLIILLLGMP